jgi:hypothetical protein
MSSSVRESKVIDSFSKVEATQIKVETFSANESGKDPLYVFQCSVALASVLQFAKQPGCVLYEYGTPSVQPNATTNNVELEDDDLTSIFSATKKRPRLTESEDDSRGSAMDTTTQPTSITTEEVLSLREQIDAKNTELNDLKTKHAKDINTLTMQHNNKITELESEKAIEINAKNAELTNLETRHAQDIHTLTMQHDTKIAELESEKTAELNTKNEEIVKLKEENARLKKDNIDMDKETIALDSKLNAARIRISELTAENSSAANAQLEQEIAKVRRDLLLAQSDVLARDNMLNRVRDDHGGRGNFDKYMKDNFTASEIKQIKKNPLIQRIASTSTTFFESFQTVSGELQEMKNELNSNKKILRAVLDRCYYRVNVHDIEGLENYRP